MSNVHVATAARLVGKPRSGLWRQAEQYAPGAGAFAGDFVLLYALFGLGGAAQAAERAAQRGELGAGQNAIDLRQQLGVENLDSFYAFNPNISALSGYANPLIAYRGDRHYGGGFAHLAEVWRKTRRPHLYAGDFDAKGVTLALDSGATHLLLPDMAWLTQHATPLHQPAGQLPYQRRLRQLHVGLSPQHPLRPYLTLLEKQRGLKQQWFEGELVAVGFG